MEIWERINKKKFKRVLSKRNTEIIILQWKIPNKKIILRYKELVLYYNLCNKAWTQNAEVAKVNSKAFPQGYSYK